MKNSKTNIKKVLIPLIILPLVSCGPKYEIQNVIYVSGDQTLYSTERHILFLDGLAKNTKIKLYIQPNLNQKKVIILNMKMLVIRVD